MPSVDDREMHAVAGDQQVGRGAPSPRRPRRSAIGTQPERAGRAWSTGTARPRRRPSRRRPSAASRAAARPRRWREATVCASPSRPSIDAPHSHQNGCPQPTTSSSKRAGFERHDDEGRQRDRDDVGADAVKARAVEMVTARAGISAISTARPVAISRRASRGRSAPTRPPRAAGTGAATSAVEWSATIAVTAAKLIWKLGAGQRFGPEQQDDQRAGGDQADADRVAPERNPAEDQQRRDAASHRRHLRAGQQGVADARRGRDAGRDQHQVEAQREPLAQRQQLAGSGTSRSRPPRRCAGR